jgi:hypothetical protein
MRSLTCRAGLLLVMLTLAASFASSRFANAAGAYCPGGPAHRIAQTAPAELATAIAKAFDVFPDTIADGAYVR